MRPKNPLQNTTYASRFRAQVTSTPSPPILVPRASNPFGHLKRPGSPGDEDAHPPPELSKKESYDCTGEPDNLCVEI